MTKRRPFAVLLWFALPLLVIILAMSWCFPARGANGFSTWIIALEFAWNYELYVKVMDVVASSAELDNILMGHWIDFAFMFCYAGFLASFFYLGWKQRQKKWIFLGFLLSTIAFLADVQETNLLITLNSILEPFMPVHAAEELLTQLQVYTWIKWEALAVSFILIGVLVWQEKWWEKLFAALFCLPLCLSVLAVSYQVIWLEAFTTSISLGFVLLLLYCLLKRGKHESSRILGWLIYFKKQQVFCKF